MAWQHVFRRDIAQKCIEAKREFSMYKKSENAIYLQQAGNKLFSVVENVLMLKLGKRVRSYAQLRELVKNDNAALKLLTDAAQLHYFFYNADLHIDRYEAEVYYQSVLERIESDV
jgi:hypothetical protein